MTLTDKLRCLTDTQNITALADKSGVSRTPVIRAIKGTAEPRRSTIIALSHALNVDAGWPWTIRRIGILFISNNRPSRDGRNQRR